LFTVDQWTEDVHCGAVEELVLRQENAPGTHRTSLDMHSRTRRTLGTSAIA